MLCLGTGHQRNLLDTNWKISNTWYRCVNLIYQGTGILSHTSLFLLQSFICLICIYMYVLKKKQVQVNSCCFSLCTKCMFWLAFERCVFAFFLHFEEVCRLPVTYMNLFAKLRPLFHCTFSHIVSFNCRVTTE